MSSGSLLYLCFVNLLLAFSSFGFANVLRSAEHRFYPHSTKYEFGIEIEFSGLSLERSKDIALKVFGGQVKEAKKYVEFQSRGGRKIQQQLPMFVVHSPTYSAILVKPEFNEDSKGARSNPMNPPAVEISSTEMFDMNRFKTWIQFSKYLKEAGAIGTNLKNDVGLHITVGVGDNYPIDELVNLVRNYYLPTHREQIVQHLKVSPNRFKFFNDLSPGFQKRLYDSSYKPSKKEFMIDYFYRQTLERAGDGLAWDLGIHEVRKRVLNLKNPVDFSIVKFVPLRISSLLASWFPNDPLIKKYLDSYWIKARPVLEFREPNFDFDIQSRPKEILGLMQMTKEFGAFDHDQLMAQLSGLNVEFIKDLRKAEEDPSSEPIVIRFSLDHPNRFSDSSQNRVKELHRRSGSVLGFLDANSVGLMSYPAPENSIAFHRLPHHEKSIEAGLNPSASNSLLVRGLENKWLEYLFWNGFAPGAFGRSVSLGSMTYSTADQLQKRLDEQFPNGWVIKRIWDLATQPIRSDQNLAEEIAVFQSSKFLDSFEKLKVEYADRDPEDLIEVLKKLPGYDGWRIHGALNVPYQYFAQEHLEIETEFRVEIVLGRVLSGNSTINRWAYLQAEATGQWKGAENSQIVRDVEEYAQSVVNQLPMKLRDMNFAMDVARLTDGSFRVVETNPGGNSGFLASETESLEALDSRLRELVRVSQSKTPSWGLTRANQIVFFENLTKMHDIDSRHFEIFDFDAADMENKYLVPVDPPEFNSLFSEKSQLMGDKLYAQLDHLDQVLRVLYHNQRFERAYILPYSLSSITNHIFGLNSYRSNYLKVAIVLHRSLVKTEIDTLIELIENAQIGSVKWIGSKVDSSDSQVRHALKIWNGTSHLELILIENKDLVSKKSLQVGLKGRSVFYQIFDKIRALGKTEQEVSCQILIEKPDND